MAITPSIGDSPVHQDSAAKVTGESRYPADRVPATAWQVKVVFSNQPHARMLAMDTTDALAVPGVVAVLTAADVPLNEYGLTMSDQPVLVGCDGNWAPPASRQM